MDKKSTKDVKDAKDAGVSGAKTAKDSKESINKEPNFQTSPASQDPQNPAVAVVEQPAATPAPETMPATDAVTGAPVDTVVIVKPPKKKKLGLIISIAIIALLLISGIGFAVWYCAVYQNPENVVFDAVNKLITAEHVSPHGAFRTTIASSNDYSVDVTVTVDNSSRRLPNESNIWLMLTIRDEAGEPATDEAIKLNLGTIQMADGVAYFKLSHLSETLDQILPNIFPPTDCGPLTDCLTEENPIATALYEVADILDDEWWQISLSDILDELEVENWQADAVEKIYTCAIDAMNADNSKDLSLLYSRSRFVHVEKVANASDARPEGTTPYSVSLDYDALANFINGGKHLPSATDFYDCYNAALDEAAKHADSAYDRKDFEDAKISVDDMEDVSASDIEKFMPADTEITLYIDDWSHALRTIDVNFKIDGEDALLSLGFEYVDKPVSAPADYRPITELFEELAMLFMDDSEYPDFSCDEDDPGLCYNGELQFPVEIDSAFDFYGV